MLSQDSTDADVQGTVGGVPVDDEACLDGPTMRYTPAEERALLDLALTQTLTALNEVPIEYLTMLSQQIEEIKCLKALQMPKVQSWPKALPGLPPLPAGMELQLNILVVPSMTVTTTLSNAIYSAYGNLGHTVL